MNPELAHRWAWADIDLDAIGHNVAVLRAAVTPADVWAVVKADGYGHGAIEVARAALAAGATGLGVAFTGEGVALRSAGIDAPIIVLSEQPADHAGELVAARLTATIASRAGAEAIAAAVAAVGAPAHDVHLKVDTGMHRVGAQPDDVVDLATAIMASPGLTLAGVFTHLAVADEPQRTETAEELDCFAAVLAQLRDRGIDPGVVHAANSAASLAHPAAHFDVVRAGIAVYGIAPSGQLAAAAAELRPALALTARVSAVKRLAAGERLSYGLRYALPTASTIATVPLGYADGVRRSLSGTGTDVLIGGGRHPIVGTITMDQLLVDCGDDPVAVGDEVVLIGEQGDERVRADDWATTLDTIGYEVVCGISARVPRRYR